jgi:hypothetical protein
MKQNTRQQNKINIFHLLITWELIVDSLVDCSGFTNDYYFL